jgi:hypothetical protein
MKALAANILKTLHTPVGASVILSLIMAAMTGCQEPPLNELQGARDAVEQARQKGAPVYAPDLYSLAESELTIGEEEFYLQSEKYFWSRDYSMATRLMNLAQTDAHQALSLALKETQKSSFQQDLYQ